MAINSQTLNLSNGRKATVVYPTSTDSIDDVVSALALPAYQSVLVVVGGAKQFDNGVGVQVTQLMVRGVAKAAADQQALIIDGGTLSGVMDKIGQGVAANGYVSPLLGVAPAGLVDVPGVHTVVDGVALEPNHSHFVLVEGQQWGDETALLFKLADRLRKGLPALVVLVGGGDIAKTEILQAVRQQLPIVVVQGSGGLADEIAAAYAARSNKKKNDNAPVEDPAIAEIIDDGFLSFHPLSGHVRGIIWLILRELVQDKTLTQAWETFADYDHNADLQQKKSNRIQIAIILLGVLGTLLSIIKGLVQSHRVVRDAVLHIADASAKASGTAAQIVDSLKRDSISGIGNLVSPVSLPGSHISFGEHVLNFFLIVIPVVLTMLITIRNLFKQGNKWLLLRSAAENIKREIYQYRTRSNDYKSNAQQTLAQRVEDVTRRAMTTEVNTTSLAPYDKSKGFPPYMYAAKENGDDGFSVLNADRYVSVRLGDQLNYFKGKTVTCEKTLKRLSWAGVIIAGLGTLFAAVDLQIWIALTTVSATAVVTYLGYRQTDMTLKKYNQTYTDLDNIKRWWQALSADERAKQDQFDLLVSHTEAVLRSEQDGWVQSMQNALEEIRKNTPGADGKRAPEADGRNTPGAEEHKEEGKEEPTVEPKDAPKEEPKDAAKNEPKDTPKDAPKDPPKEEPKGGE